MILCANRRQVYGGSCVLLLCELVSKNGQNIESQSTGT